MCAKTPIKNIITGTKQLLTCHLWLAVTYIITCICESELNMRSTNSRSSLMLTSTLNFVLDLLLRYIAFLSQSNRSTIIIHSVPMP